MNLLFANDRPGTYPDSWYAASATPLDAFPPLKGDARADVCIIGAGYTGLSAALHLAQAGVDVAVVEAHRVGFGASGRNGGQVGTGFNNGQDWLENRLGDAKARALWDLAEDAKTTLRDLIRDHRIDADWRSGVAHCCRFDTEVAEAHAEAGMLAQRYGYEQIEPRDRTRMATLVGTDVYAGGTLDHGAGHIHPLRLALGLAKAAAAAGARIYENTPVISITPGAPNIVAGDHGRMTADHIILATNGYVGGLDAQVSARVMPINNYIVATEPLGEDAPLTKDIAANDTRFVVNYWRQTPDKRLLFGGGESYGYRFPRDIAAKVRPALAQVYPRLADVRIDHAWGGTLAITSHRLPHFARPAPSVYSAAGYSGHGVALAVMAGRVLAEVIGGNAARFDLLAGLPAMRFPGGGARAPLLALAMRWYSLRDRLGI